MLYLFALFLIIVLIFVNGFTDASNAITTVVATGVLSFKKATKLSAFFNLLGIMIMCLISFKVANGISSIVILPNGNIGLIILISGILSCIIFSVISSLFGIPTSETHGLIAGITGSSIVSGSFKNINVEEWIDVIIGLIWSVIGAFVIVKIIYKLLNKNLYKIDKKRIEKYQKLSSYGLSFMHGAQDGQKFIGLVILYLSIVRGTYNISNCFWDNIWIVIFVSIIMFFGVLVGGRKIVENIGSKTVQIDNVKGITSDIGTIINLCVASIFGLPVSTSHVKTMSIISLGEKSINKKNVIKIFKAWIWTFPVCFILGYIISRIMACFLFFCLL